MKRINLSITKCINTKCNFRVISETTMQKCPICKSKVVKDTQFNAQGILDNDEDGCIILKEKGRKNDSN